MKKKTKLISVFTALVCCLTSLGITANAYDDNLADFYGEIAIYDGVTYQLMEDYAVVTEAEDYLKSITILPDINGFPVTQINAYVFSECTDLYNIKFPDTLTYIDSCALDNTEWYNSKPDGPVYAGNVLYDYKGDIPENASVTIKAGTVSVSPYAFAGELDEDSYTAQETTGLVSVEFPESIETIGYGAFESCVNLETIAVPEDQSIKIEEDAFYNTKWYNSQPDGLVFLENVLYKYKGEMPAETEIVLDSSVKAISANAFYPEQDYSYENEIINANLKSIKLSNGLEYIGYGAFQSCASLTEIIIPDSVTEIGNGAFFSCTSLSSVKLPKNLTKIDTAQFALCESLNSIEIPEGVISIRELAFMNTALNDVELPLSVEIIDSGAFFVPSLKTVTIKNPKCVILDESSFVNHTDEDWNLYFYGTIKGYENSLADSYAEICGYTFDGSLGIIGDVSENGSIDLYDAIRIAEYIMNMRTFDDSMLMIADFNLDDVVDLYDVIAIAAALLPQ